MATDAKKTPKPWRAPDDVQALNPNTPSPAEAAILDALDDARATLDRLRAGSAALANRRAAAEREAADVRGLAGINQATTAEADEAAGRADDCRAAEETHAADVDAAAERVAELETAAKDARSVTDDAFWEALSVAEHRALQDLVDATVEAARCTSVVFGVMQHGAHHGRSSSVHRLYQALRADEFTLRDWLAGMEKQGFDVPTLPMNRDAWGNRFGMLFDE